MKNPKTITSFSLPTFLHMYYCTNNIQVIIQKSFIFDTGMQCYCSFFNKYLWRVHYILGTFTYVISFNPYNKSLKEAYKQSKSQRGWMTCPAHLSASWWESISNSFHNDVSFSYLELLETGHPKIWLLIIEI